MSSRDHHRSASRRSHDSRDAPRDERYSRSREEPHPDDYERAWARDEWSERDGWADRDEYERYYAKQRERDREYDEREHRSSSRRSHEGRHARHDEDDVRRRSSSSRAEGSRRDGREHSASHRERRPSSGRTDIRVSGADSLLKRLSSREDSVPGPSRKHSPHSSRDSRKDKVTAREGSDSLKRESGTTSTERNGGDKNRRGIRSSAESSSATSATPGPSAVTSSIQPSPPTPAPSSQTSSPTASMNIPDRKVPAPVVPSEAAGSLRTGQETPRTHPEADSSRMSEALPESASRPTRISPPLRESPTPRDRQAAEKVKEVCMPPADIPTGPKAPALSVPAPPSASNHRTLPPSRPENRSDMIGIPTGPAADRKRNRNQQPMWARPGQSSHIATWSSQSSVASPGPSAVAPTYAASAKPTTPSQILSAGGTAIPIGPRAYYRTDPAVPPPPPEAPPPPPEEELPPPPPLSFGHVPLPHELEIEEDPKRRNFRVTYDPALDKSVPKKGKETLRRIVGPSTPTQASPGTDPRIALPKGGRVAMAGRKRLRKELHVFVWEWDSNSVGVKPPAPPRAFMITGLSPLTTQLQISHHFRSFGRVEDCELKMDPQTGVSIGIAWVRYAHDYDDKNEAQRADPQYGHLVARAAFEATNGEKIGPSVVTVTFDDSRKTYVRTYRTELGKRYPPRKSSKPSTNGNSTAVTPQSTSDGHAVASSAAAGSYNNVAPPQSYRPPVIRDVSAMPPPNAPTGPRAERMMAHTTISSYGAHLAAQTMAATPLSVSPSTPLHEAVTPHTIRPEIHTDTPMADGSAVVYVNGIEEDKKEKKSKKVVIAPVEEDDMDLNSDDEDNFTATNPLALRNELYTSTERGRGRGHGGFVAADIPRRRAEPYEDTEMIYRRLSKVGMPYVFVARNDTMPSHITSRAIRRHFNGFLPVFVTTDEQGWYIAFNSQDAANRCKMVLDRGTLLGFRISINVRDPEALQPLIEDEIQGKYDPSHPLATPTKTLKMRKWNPNEHPKPKKTWSDAELADEARDIIIRELAEVFLRDLKNRVVNPFVSDFLSPSGRGGRFLADPPSRLIGSMYNPALRRALQNRDNDTDAPRERLWDERQDKHSDDEALESSKLPSFRKVQHLSKPSTTRRPLPSHPSLPQRPNFAARPALDIPLEERSDCASSDDLDRAFRTDTPPPPLPVDAFTRKRQAALLAFDSDDNSDEDERARKKHLQLLKDLRGDVGPAVSESEDIVMDGKHASVAPKKGKKAAPVKKVAAAKVKKGRKARGGTEEIKPALEQDMDEDVVHTELKSMVDDTPVVKMGAVTAATLEDTRPRSPTPDPFLVGIAETEEDLYYAQVALSRLTMGQSVAAEDLRDLAGVGAHADGDEDGEEESRMTHTSGSARTEGHYRIPPSQKAAHLPDRNKATVDAGSTHALATARNNRADSRRIVLGLEQHKKDTATDTDILKFNQLRTRKKQLRFAKSPIHDWGLYAMELIPAGDMVIEYVGEVVRQQVADNREKQYERGGNFSTYLFRVDDDLVVDATRKGNIARLMNHCCTPNCTAKILTLNGEKRIVLYAKDTILPGQELTYDYKFQSSGDTEDLISCLCGSPGCRRFL